MNRILAKTLALGSLLLASCSTLPTPESDISFSESGDLETLVIVGTNDIHGGLSSQSLKTREEDEAQAIPYEAGGAAYLASYLETLRNEFGSRLLWLDAGDEFQGTIESNTEQGSPVVRFFNSTGLQGAAVGNHEFDFGPNRINIQPTDNPKDVLGALKARMREAEYPYLTANTLEKISGKMPKFPNTYPSVLLKAGRLKVGVIGLTTLETAVTTLPDFVKDLVFDDLIKVTLREAARLRKLGAQSVIITAHVGLKCAPGKMPSYHMFRRPSDPQGECGPSDELVRLLKALPPGTVDAVVSGHSHQVVHHWVNGVPVIQGGASARYLNLIYLTYDLKSGKLLPDRTRIEGPVPVCPLVFQNQNDCNGDRPAPQKGRGSLVKPRFHGQTIEPNAKTTELLKPVFAKAEAAKQEVVAYAARRIDHERFQESPLGNLIADSMRAAVQTDVAIMNSGGIRAPFDSGPITYGSIFRTVPFDNSIVVLTLSGKELKTLVRISESGSRGYFSVSGIQVRLIGPAYDAPSSDLKQDKKIEPWEVNRILDIKFADGRTIDDLEMYTLATLDFLALGGDDYGWFMTQIPKSRMRMTGLITREAFVKYLRETSAARTPNGVGQYAFNGAESPLVDPANPRLKFENPKKKSSKRKARSRARSSKKRR